MCIFPRCWRGCSWEFEQHAAHQRNGLCLQAQMRPAKGGRRPNLHVDRRNNEVQRRGKVCDQACSGHTKMVIRKNTVKVNLHAALKGEIERSTEESRIITPAHVRCRHYWLLLRTQASNFHPEYALPSLPLCNQRSYQNLHRNDLNLANMRGTK